MTLFSHIVIAQIGVKTNLFIIKCYAPAVQTLFYYSRNNIKKVDGKVDGTPPSYTTPQHLRFPTLHINPLFHCLINSNLLSFPCLLSKPTPSFHLWSLALVLSLSQAFPRLPVMGFITVLHLRTRTASPSRRAPSYNPFN